jgi:hypothetical protein
MKLFFLACAAALLLLAAGCAGAPKKAAPATEAGVTEGEPAIKWRYPIAPGIWYPGDGPLPEHPFKYYRVRCWPGCHDPNSAPQPHP